MSAACGNELIPDIALISCSLCFPEFMCENGYILLSCLTSHDWNYFTTAWDVHCLVSKLRSNHSCQICLHRNGVKLWAINLKPLDAPRRLDTGAIVVLEQTATLMWGSSHSDRAQCLQLKWTAIIGRMISVIQQWKWLLSYRFYCENTLACCVLSLIK